MGKEGNIDNQSINNCKGISNSAEINRMANKCPICQKEFFDLTSYIMHEMTHDAIEKRKMPSYTKN